MRTRLGLLALLGACTANVPGNVVHGTIGGTTYTMASAASVVGMNPTTGASGAVIYMASTPKICDDISNNILHPDEQLFVIELVDGTTQPTSAPSIDGDYMVGTMSGLFGGAVAEASDASCKTVPGSLIKATEGTITLTSFHGDAFAGHFELTMASGDAVTGAFNGEACPGLPAGLAASQMTPSACI